MRLTSIPRAPPAPNRTEPSRRHPAVPPSCPDPRSDHRRTPCALGQPVTNNAVPAREAGYSMHDRPRVDGNRDPISADSVSHIGTVLLVEKGEDSTISPMQLARGRPGESAHPMKAHRSPGGMSLRG